MSKNYDHKEIEAKWQKKWDDEQVYRAENETVGENVKPKFYGLIEFPFPSGDGMHVGHLRSNTGMDIISRKRRMEGFNVLYPIGWDAFGLPTENYAIKTGKQPALVTKENTDRFRKQLKSAGFSFDWSREINTTNPKYYKWTQWIFLQMFKKGLAYKKRMVINWCPKDKIGLANEEVVDGACERCGTPVEKREKEQWMLAITKYADRLYDDLDTVDYINQVKIQQRNWIGRSEGSELEFKIKDSAEKIKVFTTRADTLFGVTYVVLAPEHELVQKLKGKISNSDEVEKYLSEVKNKSDIDRTAENKTKTGVLLRGIFAINPATKEEVPVWIADYVLASYGTGAVMAVPAHDERDFQFAQKYKLPIKNVLEPITGIEKENEEKRKSIVAVVRNPKTGMFISINWGKPVGNLFVGGGRDEGEDVIATAKREIAEETGYTNFTYIAQTETIHHHYFAHSKNVARDIEAVGLYFELVDETRTEPKLEENEKNKFTVEWLSAADVEKKVEDELHKYVYNKLIKNSIFTGNGLLTNSNTFNGLTSEVAKKEITEFAGGKMVTTFKLRDWIFSRQRYWGEPIPMVHCDACAKAKPESEGWIAVPEKDLPIILPEVENYTPTDTGESPLSKIDSWVKTTCPSCGGPATRETDTMPNWAGSSWYYLRYTDTTNDQELASKSNLGYWTPVDWYNGGMEHVTLHLLYSRFWHKFLFDIGAVPTTEPYKKRTSHGFILAENNEKMSKSRGNVVNPDKIIETYGADTLRLYEMFAAPFEQAFSWKTESIIGPRRFVERLWKLKDKVDSGVVTNAELEKHIHRTIKKIGEDIESMSFNTAVSQMMILVNEFEKLEKINQKDYETFLKILAPFAPHVTEELWSELSHTDSIHRQKWPTFDESKLKDENVRIIIQVNGKVRGSFTTEADSDEQKVQRTALSMPEIAKWVEGNAIKKVIFVKNKLINIVL